VSKVPKARPGATCSDQPAKPIRCYLPESAYYDYKPGPPWRDALARGYDAPQPGLGQGLGQGELKLRPARQDFARIPKSGVVG